MFVGTACLFSTTPTFAQTQQAEAESSNCTQEDAPSYTGRIVLPIGAYDVYVKLGKIGQDIPVGASAYTESGTSTCVSIGAINASSDEWRKIGAYSSTNASMEMIFQLSSETLQNLPDANRPSLMLVPQENPVCTPKIECETTIANQTAYIRPNGIALDDNMLNIFQVTDPAHDKLLKVEYYADSELLYNTAQLESFNESFVPYYATKLYRVMYYDSGQKVIIENQTHPIADSSLLFSMLLKTFKHYEQTLRIVGLALGIVLALTIIRLVILALDRRHRWRLAHGFDQPKAIRPLSAKDKRNIQRISALKKLSKVAEVTILCVSAVVLLVLATSTYFIQVNQVNGYSMENSLKNGQRVIVNKWPVTFARMNGRAYTPNRNEVVIAYPNFGSSLDQSQVNDDNTIIKRVIGLPGERIVIDQDTITIYNREHPDGFNPQVGTSWQSNVITDDSLDTIDVTIGINEVFLCGDNRPVSIDSRYNGPVNLNQIIGIVIQ